MLIKALKLITFWNLIFYCNPVSYWCWFYQVSPKPKGHYNLWALGLIHIKYYEAWTAQKVWLTLLLFNSFFMILLLYFKGLRHLPYCWYRCPFHVEQSLFQGKHFMNAGSNAFFPSRKRNLSCLNYLWFQQMPKILGHWQVFFTE